MKEKFCKWDVVDHLYSAEEMQAYFEACCEEDPGDGSLISAALGDIARARGMTQLARDTGLDRSSLYRALSANGKAEFATIMKVTRALGLSFSGTKAHPPIASQ